MKVEKLGGGFWAPNSLGSLGPPMDLFKNQVQAKVSLSGPMWGFGVFMHLPWIKGLPGRLKFRAPGGL